MEFRAILSPYNGNQVEKKMENEMEIGITQEFQELKLS